jgi:hypothetical protein
VAEAFDVDQANGRVYVIGLARLRKDLRSFDKAANRALGIELRSAAGLIAAEANANAPGHDRDPDPSQTLKGSLRPFVSGTKVGVRSRLPYAAPLEWGGTISPRGAPINLKRSRFLGRAIHDQLEAFEDRLVDTIEAVAAKHGWK